MEVKDLPDPVEEDQSARDMDAHILQRKRHKEDGSSSKGKRSKASAVQKVEEVHVSARRKQRAVVLDSSDPEQADLQLLPPKRVRKQVRSPSSPTKYKVCVWGGGRGGGHIGKVYVHWSTYQWKLLYYTVALGWFALSWCYLFFLYSSESEKT